MERNGIRVATASAPAADSGKAPSHASDTHKVARGESLSSIARRYGVSVGALKTANQISSNIVQAGAMLTIPSG